MRTSVLLAIFWLAAGGAHHAIASAPADGKIRESVKFAVDFLKSQQSPETGGWPEYAGYPGGVTALCTLALLKSGVGRDDDVIRKSLEHLQNLEAPDLTYTNALQIMVYCEAGAMEFEELIERNVRWLENAQATAGGDRGGWTYTNQPRAKQVDGSNTHFALVALHEASKAGVSVKAATWRRAHQFWIKRQHADGSWHYSSLFDDSPSGSMTCAGIVSLTITADQLGNSKTVQKQSDAAIRRAFAWLEENFSVRKNPGARPVHTFGYLYTLSQAGELTNQRLIGQHDWYQEGAQMLIETQDVLQGFWRGTHVVEENRLITTCYALLFLASR